MKSLARAVLVVATFGVVGCAEEGRYMGSGETCGPNDPVLTLDASDCMVPGGV